MANRGSTRLDKLEKLIQNRTSRYDEDYQIDYIHAIKDQLEHEDYREQHNNSGIKVMHSQEPETSIIESNAGSSVYRPEPIESDFSMRDVSKLSRFMKKSKSKQAVPIIKKQDGLVLDLTKAERRMVFSREKKHQRSMSRRNNK